MSSTADTTFHCRIDAKAIEKYTKLQRAVGRRITLVDTVCSGLRLVINARSSTYTYPYRRRGYRDGGKRHPQRWLTLGDPSTTSPAEARVLAEAAKATVRGGGDPAIDQRRQRAEQELAAARALMLGEWLQRYAQTRLESGRTKHQREEWRNARQAIEELGLAGSTPEALTAKRLRELLDYHRDRPATARHRFGAVSRFLDFLMDEDVIQLNPSVAVSRKWRPKPPPARSNYFAPEVLRLLWRAEGLKPVYARFLRFMITTPLRASEGAELRRHHLHPDQAELRLTADDTKNREPFVMPLSEAALAALPELPSSPGARVFPLSSAVGRPMTAWSFFNRSVRAATRVGDFALHDLRRTFATLMAEHSAHPETLIDGLLNHRQSASRGGVMRHYQHAKHLSARRQVMEDWGQMLRGWGCHD